MIKLTGKSVREMSCLILDLSYLFDYLRSGSQLFLGRGQKLVISRTASWEIVVENSFRYSYIGTIERSRH